MKNFFKTALLGGACAGMLLTGCQRTEQAVPPAAEPKADVSVTDGMLVFKNRYTFSAYSKSLDDVPKGMRFDDFMQQKEKQLNFVSLRSASLVNRRIGLAGARTTASEGIEDEYLAAMLNPENMIQIGRWICRVDVPKQQVYVLDEKDRRLLDELRKDRPTHPKVLTFSTDEDVLPLLESGEKSGKVNLFCFREGGRPSRIEVGENARVGKVYYEGLWYDDTHYYNYINHGFYADIKHVYQKAGVYFSLLSEMKYMTIPDPRNVWVFNQRNTEITLQCYWNYQVKCGGSAATVVPYEVRYTPNDNKLNWRMYEGVSGLHKYFINSTYIYKRRDLENIYNPNGSGQVIPNPAPPTYERVELNVIDEFN